MVIIRRLLAVWLLVVSLFLSGKCESRPSDAVCRVMSHGCSATCIYSSGGKSYLLGCGHAYEGSDRFMAMAIDAPAPVPGPAKRAKPQLIALDYNADLSLVVVPAEMTYVCPIAPTNYRIVGPTRSVGYDRMSVPAVCYRATVIGSDRMTTYTQENPIPGRSGGALIDGNPPNTYLIGVVQGYEMEGPRRGMYVSLQTIQSFLSARGYGGLYGASAQSQPILQRPRVGEYTTPEITQPFAPSPTFPGLTPLISQPGCPPSH